MPVWGGVLLVNTYPFGVYVLRSLLYWYLQKQLGSRKTANDANGRGNQIKKSTLALFFFVMAAQIMTVRQIRGIEEVAGCMRLIIFFMKFLEVL